MKRITFLLLLAASFFATNVLAKSDVLIPTYFVNQDFTGAVAYPTGTTTNPGTWSAGTALWGASAGVSWTAPAANQLNIAGSGSGTRGITINYTSSGTESTVYMDYDFLYTSAYIGQKNAWGMMIDDASGNLVFCLYTCGNDGKFHVWNQDNTTAAFIGGSFNKASSVNIAGTNELNLSTQVNLPLVTGNWYNVLASLDFTNHVILSLKITNKTTSDVVTLTNLPMVSSTATNVSKISVTNTKSSNAGNGGSANFSTSIDNFKTYKVIDVVTKSVTINYKNAGGTLLKTSRIQPDLEVGSIYYATSDDKATFSDASNYYAYDAVATVADNVVVAEGAEINLVFKTTPITSGNYLWTGTTNSFWNNADENFTTDNVNSIGYQNGNQVVFPATATNKTVILTDDVNTGTNDVYLSGGGYSITGTKTLSGTGAFNVDPGTSNVVTFGVKNNMSGGLEIASGKAIVTNDLGTGAYSVGNDAIIDLQTGAAFSKSITATGSITIIPTSNVSYTSTIINGDALNYILGSAGSVTTAGVFSAMPILNNTFSGTINVNTTLETAMFGSINNFTNNKLYLSDNVSLVYPVNPASDGSTTISIGELSGTATSRLMGPRLRTVTYNVGGLGTNATFNGTIENFEADAWTNIPILNFTKSGAGQLTLTGESTNYVAGTVNVNGGTLHITGTLGATTVPVIVGAEGKLSGTGTIAGATTVNGTLEGNLNFGGTLALTGTTKFVVNGVNTGEFDAIDVVGSVNLGGVVEVTVNTASGVKGVDKVRNANPPVGTRIKLINAGSITTSLSPIHYPSSGWTFVPASGELVYDPSNVVTGLGNNSIEFRIYPTLTRDNVNIEGNVIGIEIINLAGQKVKQLQANSTKTVVSMNNLSAGAYFVKALMVDGSVNVQNVILQK